MYEADFVAFWDRYPRKVGRFAAFKAYLTARRRATATDILNGVDALRAALDPDALRFCPHPATWLNAGRWLDEAPPARAPGRIVVEGRADCQHEPRCPSNTWHAVENAYDAVDLDAAIRRRAARAARGAATR